MELLRMMLKSTGWLSGGAMLLAGLTALILCVLATWVRTPRARRAAVIASLTPIVLAFLAVPWGAMILWRASQRGEDIAGDWTHLGYIVLFGLTISVVPLLWSALLRLRPVVAPGH